MEEGGERGDGEERRKPLNVSDFIVSSPVTGNNVSQYFSDSPQELRQLSELLEGKNQSPGDLQAVIFRF